MITALIARWVSAFVLALICGTSYLLDGDPDALQDVADDVAAIGQDLRYDTALTAIGEQRP